MRVREGVLEHARRSSPEECVGLLIGKEKIEDFIPLRNLHPAPRQGYLLDSAEVAKHLGRGIVGLYHSHPAGGGQASCLDDPSGFEHYWIVDPLNGKIYENHSIDRPAPG